VSYNQNWGGFSARPARLLEGHGEPPCTLNIGSLDLKPGPYLNPQSTAPQRTSMLLIYETRTKKTTGTWLDTRTFNEPVQKRQKQASSLLEAQYPTAPSASPWKPERAETVGPRSARRKALRHPVHRRAFSPNAPRLSKDAPPNHAARLTMVANLQDRSRR